jgi:hypothetical protein
MDDEQSRVIASMPIENRKFSQEEVASLESNRERLMALAAKVAKHPGMASRTIPHSAIPAVAMAAARILNFAGRNNQAWSYEIMDVMLASVL